ncbi:MAG: hypothetical protein NTW74_21545 [Acidobacteria bacterium]|nr:hypothetical protein [Acidobacteriota bacterium]
MESLIHFLLGPQLAEEILGDLEEESLLRGSNWRRRQLLLSVLPLLGLRLRHFHIEERILLASGLFLLPVRAIDLLWAFVLSQVPLKVDLIRPTDHLLFTLALALACAFVCSLYRQGMGIWLGVAALIALGTIPAQLPLWYWLLLPALCFAVVKAVDSRRRTS